MLKLPFHSSSSVVYFLRENSQNQELLILFRKREWKHFFTCVVIKIKIFHIKSLMKLNLFRSVSLLLCPKKQTFEESGWTWPTSNSSHPFHVFVNFSLHFIATKIFVAVFHRNSTFQRDAVKIYDTHISEIDGCIKCKSFETWESFKKLKHFVLINLKIWIKPTVIVSQFRRELSLAK